MNKLKSKNYRWVNFYGKPCIWNLKTDEWVIQINDGRIYFKAYGEFSSYKTSDEIYTDLYVAKSVCTHFLNSYLERDNEDLIKYIQRLTDES
jgi:hypothetical protein